MAAWIVPPVPGLIEPFVAPEYFVDKTPGAIERVGTNLRFYLYSKQLPLEAGATSPGLIVQCKITRPIEGLSETAILLLQCLSDYYPQEIRPRGPWPPRLVR